MSYLTETAAYDEPGSWGRASEGWPEITGDVAHEMYVFANRGAIPYGSYVLMDERGRYGATESVLRVHPDQIQALRDAFAAKGG